MHAAIRTLGLSELKPFDPRERVIEYRSHHRRLASMRVSDFIDELSSDSPPRRRLRLRPGRIDGRGTRRDGGRPLPHAQRLRIETTDLDRIAVARKR